MPDKNKENENPDQKDVNKAIEETQTLIKDYHAKNDEELKKHDALNVETQKKIESAIADNIELKQRFDSNEKAHKEAMEQLNKALNRQDGAGRSILRAVQLEQSEPGDAARAMPGKSGPPRLLGTRRESAGGRLQRATNFPPTGGPRP